MYIENVAGISDQIVLSVGFHILAEHFASKVKFWWERGRKSTNGLQTVTQQRQKMMYRDEYRWFSVTVTFIDQQLLKKATNIHVTWSMREIKHLNSMYETLCSDWKTKVTECAYNVGVNVSLFRLVCRRLFGFLYCPIHGRLFSLTYKKRFCSFR